MGDDPLFTFDEDSPPRDFRDRSSTPDPLEQATAAAAAAIAGYEPPSSSASRKRAASTNQSVRRSSPRSHPYLHFEPPDSKNRSGNPTPSPASRSGRYLPPYHYVGGAPPPYYHGGSRTPSRSTEYPGYSPYDRFEHSPWEGSLGGRPYPPPHAATTGPPYDSDEDSLPQPPPSSTKKRPHSPTQVGQHGSSTSEKMALDKTRSPFRSPLRADLSHGKSNKPFRSSPFFQPSPNNLGTLGSFGMETPCGTLANASFSPKLPSFELDEDAVAFQLGEEGFADSRLNISRSHSQDSESSALEGLGRRRYERSPLSEYMHHLSPVDAPGMQGAVRSPLHHHPRPSSAAGTLYPAGALRSSAPAGTVGTRPKGPGAVTMSGGRSDAPSSRLDAGAKPKQLWPPSADSGSKTSKSSETGTPGPVRLEIGGSSSLSKTLKGINSMMQHPRPPRGTTPLDRGVPSYRRTPTHHPAAPPPYHQSSHPPHQGEMATPIKSYHSRQPPPGHHPYQHPGSGNKPMYPASASKSAYPDSRGPSKPLYMGHPIDGKPASAHGSIPTPGGKENKKKLPTKRSVCNCKKSRCLKLYCECFAAELFCQGCNCEDCHNTPDAGIEREKAIKDTRAKNSKAFQTRFGVKDEPNGETPQRIHNMGCKCKKSECLKKYCEVCRAGIS
jgi:Tesmin/TSO1-like CXC domain, cysteine-rich domain